MTGRPNAGAGGAFHLFSSKLVCVKVGYVCPVNPYRESVRLTTGMLEHRTSESRAIIPVLESGYEIKGRVSSLEIFQQFDSGRRVVKAKITRGLVPDSDS